MEYAIRTSKAADHILFEYNLKATVMREAFLAWPKTARTGKSHGGDLNEFIANIQSYELSSCERRLSEVYFATNARKRIALRRQFENGSCFNRDIKVPGRLEIYEVVVGFLTSTLRGLWGQSTQLCVSPLDQRKNALIHVILMVHIS